MLVIDTGVVVAAARPWETEHDACRQLLQTQERRVIPAPVLVEVAHFLAGTLGWPALLDDVVLGALDVEALTIADYRRVVELQERYADLAPGFVDCAVLAVVERVRETKLATLDYRHFRVMRPGHVESLRLVPFDDA